MILPENTFYAENRAEWRTWLENNHEIAKNIWLIYYKKHTKKPSVPYNDAVEEALCFGWIDSTVRKLDDERYMQIFTPRNKKSSWSELNLKRMDKMLKEDKVAPKGMEIYNLTKHRISESISYDNEIYQMSEMFRKMLYENKEAAKFYESLAPSHKRTYNLWINSAKKEETKTSRIEKTIQRLLENKKNPI